jgi:hypothetical protein
MAKTLEKGVAAAIELAILEAQRTRRNPDLPCTTALTNPCYIRRRIERHQRTGVDDRKTAGRKPLAEQDKSAEAVKRLLAQSAICDYIFDEFGVEVCQATVSRIFKRNGIPHKASNRLYRKSKLSTANKRRAVTRNQIPIANSLLSSLSDSCEMY